MGDTVFAIDFTTPKRKYNNEANNQVFNAWHVASSQELANISSPEQATPHSEGKRGRPRSELITSLIQEGAQSPSNIKCVTCGRVFPRDKSLQAHLRTHTGERPFHCIYPGCFKSFAQSGQLNTHNRLHSGEKPFQCSAEGCTNRFTHANRHCNDHPHASIRRNPDENFVPIIPLELSEAARQWHRDYQKAKEDRTPKERNKRHNNDIHTPASPSPSNNKDMSTPPVKKIKSKRGLGPLMDQEQRLNIQCYTMAHENVWQRLSVIEHSETRYSSGNESEFRLEMEGVKPLDAEENFNHASNLILSVQDRGLDLSHSFFPDQLCTGDRTPMKNHSRDSVNSRAVEEKLEQPDSGADVLSADILAVPSNSLYNNRETVDRTEGRLFESSTKYKPLKKRWLLSLKSNLESSTSSTAPKQEPTENKDTILGAMALVQLAKVSEEPLNLSIRRD